jgi:signal recognition particle subunit SRP54
MGDVLTLIEQAEQAFDAEQAEAAAEKIGRGSLTLDDFLEQMLTIRKMGPIGNLLGMLPGAGQMKDQLSQVDDTQMDRVQAIIRGMTPAERDDPKIINGSRRRRIALGSGVEVREINELVDRFFEARKMMSQMAGGMSMPGGAGKGTKKSKGKKSKKAKGRSPAPAKARGMPAGMPDMAALARAQEAQQQAPPGLSGLDQLPTGFDPSKLDFVGKSKKQ